MNIGERIRTARMNLQMSGKELSEASGVDNSYISEIENGHRSNPTSEILVKFSKALNVTTDYLLGLDVTEDNGGLRGAAIRTLSSFNYSQLTNKELLDALQIINRGN